MRLAILAIAVLASPGLQAWNCEHERRIETSLDLAGSESLMVRAAAGDLEIIGSSEGTVAEIEGRVCASKEEWAEQAAVDTRDGKKAEIVVELPDTEGNWSLLGGSYAYMDLRLTVPDNLPLEVRDSSGDIEIEGVGELSVKDSSGDIEIEDSRGPIFVEDSSGDIEFTDIGGDVTVESDSSGDIDGRDIQGSVLVRHDSSGDIDFRDVSRDFTVERDSSGEISANRIGGDFVVERDGSGDINALNVKGEVSIPDDSS